MDFNLTKEQKELKREVITFARNELNGYKKEIFSREAWQKCADFGLLGMNISEEYGGMGLDYLTSAILLDALGYACEDSGFIFAITNHLWVCQNLIYRLGDKGLRERYLPLLTSGESIGCFAITEAESGSDVYGMRTIAEECEHGYYLTGNKLFISNAPIADVFVVIAKTNDDYTAFVVEKNYEGVSVGKHIDKMGLGACPMSELCLDHTFIPNESILYKVGKGKKVANYALQTERVFEFASHVGAMEREMEQCIAYSNERIQFGQPIKNNQAVSNKIAEMKVAIELARVYLHRTAWKVDQNKSFFLDSSIFKLFVSEQYLKTCIDSLQLHGAYGYSKEYGIERELRDAVASRIYSGTSEVQKNIVFGLIDSI